MNRIKFAPSILSADFNVLGQQVAETARAGAPYVHIDVCDGSFVPSISFGMPVVKCLRKTSDLFFDVHLMTVHPEKFVRPFAEAGADGITFHYEAVEDPGAVIASINEVGKRVGMAIKPQTPVEAVIPYIHRLDMLLIMTVEPGFGGQKYLKKSTRRIMEARKLFEEEEVDIDIQVDGGIKLDNVDVVLDAGANVIVAGSA
ncbi:MAG: ribulose-phosphate 3-epimerase, partial [Lachnospiraceae bacterium]|nr:ribulose-phosphate 3-epimerase [Lachnospiraceae bacterium]